MSTKMVVFVTRSVAGFKEFPGRYHGIIASGGWREMADHVSAWIDQHQESR
jgi:hypothetical protein